MCECNPSKGIVCGYHQPDAMLARSLSVTLEAICKRFESGHVPRVQDVRYIRQASVVLKRD